MLRVPPQWHLNCHLAWHGHPPTHAHHAHRAAWLLRLACCAGSPARSCGAGGGAGSPARSCGAGSASGRAGRSAAQ